MTTSDRRQNILAPQHNTLDTRPRGDTETNSFSGKEASLSSRAAQPQRLVKKRRKKNLGNALREYPHLPPALFLLIPDVFFNASNASFSRPKCSAQYLVIIYFASTYAVHHVSFFFLKKKHKPEQHEKHLDRHHLGSPMPLCQNALVLDLLLCLYDIY